MPVGGKKEKKIVTQNLHERSFALVELEGSRTFSKALGFEAFAGFI